MILSNIKIAAKIALLGGVLVAMTALVGVLGLNSMSATVHGLKTVYEDRVVPLRDIKVIADMYAVNIVDTAHKTRNGNLPWPDALRRVGESAFHNRRALESVPGNGVGRSRARFGR